MIIKFLNQFKYNLKFKKTFMIYQFSNTIYNLSVLLYNYNYFLKIYIFIINNKYFIFYILNSFKSITYIKLYLKYNQLFYVKYNKLVHMIRKFKYFKGLLILYSLQYKFITHLLALKYKSGGILIFYIN